MVQILPQQQTLGSLLGQGLGAGVSTGVSQKLEQFYKQKSQQDQMKQLSQLLGFGEQPTEMQQQTKDGKAQEQISPLKQQETNLEKIATNPLAIASIASKNPQLSNQILQMYGNLLKKRKQEKAEEFISPQTKERLTDTFSRFEELLKTGDVGPIASKKALLSEKGRENVAEFNTLSSSVEAALLPLVSKGTLAKQRFEYIMSLLPKASNTVATNKGKIKALKREFGLLEKEGKIKQTKPTGFQKFEIGNKVYNIPADKVEEFKKDMGL